MKYMSIVLAVLVLDFAGFWLWALSGQVPADGFFIGAISKWVFGLFIG